MVVVYPERKKNYHRVNLHDASGADPRAMKHDSMPTRPGRGGDFRLDTQAYEVDDLLGVAHGRKRKQLIDMVWKTTIIGIALATLGTNVYALGKYGGFIQFIACAIACAASTTIAYIEVTMENTARQNNISIKELRQLAIGYSRENSRLAQQLRDMKVKLFCRQEAESRLKFMLRGQKIDTRTVINLATKNHQVTAELKQQARSNMVEDLFCVLYQDEKIKDTTDRVVMNLLKYINTLPSVIVNDRRLNKLYQGKPPDSKLLGMMHCLCKINVPTRERIFIFDDEDEELQNAVSDRLAQRAYVKQQALLESKYEEEPLMIPLNDEEPTPRTFADLLTGGGRRRRGRSNDRQRMYSDRCRSTSPSKELKERKEPKRGRGLLGAKSMPRVDRKKFFAAAKGPKKGILK